MTERIESLILFTELGFTRLEMAIKDLQKNQLDWKVSADATTIRWILTHLTEVLQVFVPKVLTGNKEYRPDGWPEDYKGNQSYSMVKILMDLESSKTKFIELLQELDPASLDENIDWFFGVKTREVYLILAISEIHHHEGQVASILGAEKRMNGLH